MREIYKILEAAAPDEAKAFAKEAKRLPEWARNIVAAIAEYVEIERQAEQMGAVERARQARAHQLALFGLIAAGATDPQWPPVDPRHLEKVARRCNSLRLKFVELRNRPKEGFVPPVTKGHDNL